MNSRTESIDSIGHTAPKGLTCIDLFAGCGGLSLGLHQAGWEGIFAVERSPMAFETLKHNLISRPGHFPHWPAWFPKEACSIQKLISRYPHELKELRGKVMMIAGGPPCQGFSHAGKRNKQDPRNQLYKLYLDVVRLVRPSMVLMENVTGITREFGGRKPRGRGQPPMAYSKRIERALTKLGYTIANTEVLASDYGVPQSRVRFVAIGVDYQQFSKNSPPIRPDKLLESIRPAIFAAHNLPPGNTVSCRDALSDLEYNEGHLADCPDSKNYKAGRYSEPVNAYQRLMRGALCAGEVADSHRFVKHRDHIVSRFAKILAECPRGKNLPDAFRKQYGIKKACIVPLDPAKPSTTLTTIPDDMIHYSQPRVLTVRECARLQSFPDWFAIRSKYTTGGRRRKVECPRYTQIGNAVPPLLGEALGRALASWIQGQSSVAEIPCSSQDRVALVDNEWPIAIQESECRAVG